MATQIQARVKEGFKLPTVRAADMIWIKDEWRNVPENAADEIKRNRLLEYREVKQQEPAESPPEDESPVILADADADETAAAEDDGQADAGQSEIEPDEDETIVDPWDQDGIIATPAAKKLAGEYGLVPEHVIPTGQDGSYTKTDVQRAIQRLAESYNIDPKALKLAINLEVDYTIISGGSGKNGMITIQDVEAQTMDVNELVEKGLDQPGAQEPAAEDDQENESPEDDGQAQDEDDTQEPAAEDDQEGES